MFTPEWMIAIRCVAPGWIMRTAWDIIMITSAKCKIKIATEKNFMPRGILPPRPVTIVRGV